MYKLTNLPASEKAKVAATMARLALQLGEELGFEIMPIQGCSESALLELSVNGRYAKPVRVFESSEAPADVICRELETLVQAHRENAARSTVDAKSYCGANPKYNGQHRCPQCNAPSFWACADADTASIRIDCSGRCGTYQKRYSDLAALPFSGIRDPLAA